MREEEKHLAALIKQAQKKTARDKWHSGGKFIGIKPLSAGDKGGILEDFAVYLGRRAGYEAFRNPQERDDYDIVIGGRTFEVKCATEDVHGNFQFNGISHSKNYDFLLVLGVSPDAVAFNIYAKAEVVARTTTSMSKTSQKDGNTVYKFTHKAGDLHPIEQFAKTLAQCLKSASMKNKGGAR